MCEKMEQGDTLEAENVEEIVKTVITYTEENSERAYQVKKDQSWIAVYIVSFFIGCIGMFFNYITEKPCWESLGITLFLYTIFGGYFCCFVKTKLPQFYDENNLNFFSDGVFRMNIVGMKFNNRNWQHIVKTIRISICASMMILPVINFTAGNIIPYIWNSSGKYILLVVVLCSLLLPMYIVGKKYE